MGYISAHCRGVGKVWEEGRGYPGPPRTPDFFLFIPVFSRSSSGEEGRSTIQAVRGRGAIQTLGTSHVLNVSPGTPQAGSHPGQAGTERLRLGREWPSSWAGSSPGETSPTFPGEPCFSTTSTKGPGERPEILPPKRQHEPSAASGDKQLKIFIVYI